MGAIEPVEDIESCRAQADQSKSIHRAWVKGIPPIALNKFLIADEGVGDNTHDKASSHHSLMFAGTPSRTDAHVKAAMREKVMASVTQLPTNGQRAHCTENRRY
jgi:hypothetical protein